MADLHVGRWGRGPEVLLVHGSLLNGEQCWGPLRPMAERWTLIVPSRRGYWPNPPIEREDFSVDAEDVAALLGDGMHLVGLSYGGLIALLAAARRPEAVRSLTVIEPPATDLARDDAGVDGFAVAGEAYWRDGPREPEAFVRGFAGLIGGDASTLPSPFPPPLLQQAELLMRERGYWEARIPVEPLRAASFPKLVVSAGQSPAFFATICDALARHIGAERLVIPGVGHHVPAAGTGSCEPLEGFLQEAERATATHA
jgi:pimeloyl-ACP methyl ester carboxylesterase